MTGSTIAVEELALTRSGRAAARRRRIALLSRHLHLNTKEECRRHSGKPNSERSTERNGLRHLLPPSERFKGGCSPVGNSWKFCRKSTCRRSKVSRMIQPAVTL